MFYWSTDRPRRAGGCVPEHLSIGSLGRFDKFLHVNLNANDAELKRRIEDFFRKEFGIQVQNWDTLKSYCLGTPTEPNIIYDGYSPLNLT